MTLCDPSARAASCGLPSLARNITLILSSTLASLQASKTSLYYNSYEVSAHESADHQLYHCVNYTTKLAVFRLAKAFTITEPQPQPAPSRAKMGAKSWAVPVGVLAAIVAVGLIFFWIWFPRAWQYGVNRDADEIDTAPIGPEREAQRQRNREIIERFARARARERGELVEDDDVEMAGASNTKTPPAPATVA